MSQLLKKQPPKIVQNVETNSVRNKGEKPTPKEQECAGWCGEVYLTSQLTEYRKKMYCANCLEIKQNELTKAKKPAGLTEEQVKALFTEMIQDFSTDFRKTKETIDLSYEQLKAFFNQRVEQVEKLVYVPNSQLRDLVVAAKTIMGHFVVLDRFSKSNQNKRQGDDMRAWITAADKILEGSSK